MATRHTAVNLLRAAHAGPTLAVTALTALLAHAAGHGLGSGALVTAAVFSGQLSIGWSNDLLDASRDREVGRPDKPLARGDLAAATVRRAIAAAVVACVLLSLACGPASAAVHLGFGVSSGWLYNLIAKRTWWSPVPYALAFGALPAVVTLALPSPALPPWWMVASGALLGVGAHLLNALPDLTDDALTGVRSLPQRLGPAAVRRVAPLVLVAASAVIALGPTGGPGLWSWVTLAGCVLLAVVAATSRGRMPFRAAMLLAGLNVVSLVLRA